MTSNARRPIPQGYQEPELIRVPTVKPSAFREGRLVRYHGVETVSQGKRDTAIHRVSAPDDTQGEKMVGIWGTSRLDGKLRGFRAGELVYLRYEGKVPHPTNASQEVHDWTVARPSAPAAVAPDTDTGEDELPF